MSKHRVSPAAGWVQADKLPRGPNGRACCRGCGTEVPRGRRSFCSPACVESWRYRTDPGFCRAMVERRDRGVCAICGLDTERLAALVHGLDRKYRLHPKHHGFMRRFKARHGVSHRFCGWLWDMDHTTPVVEGGGECGLDGYRTLCIWCHRRETAALRARLARKRNPQQALFEEDPE